MRSRTTVLCVLASGLLESCNCGGTFVTGGVTPEDSATECADGTDDDQDGLVDCDDPDCAVFGCGSDGGWVDGGPRADAGTAADSGASGEGRPCQAGETQKCYSGPSTQAGVGACAFGTRECLAVTELGGTWGPCVGAGQPSVEFCDGFDNDCNGVVDDGFVQTTCGVGACQRTIDVCASGSLQACVPGQPVSEVCNGLDDDCDGVVDQGFGEIGCGTGECARAVPACQNGAPQACTPGAPGVETCDGKDNDCDGQVDEDIPDITCGQGLCLRTVSGCANGVPGVCVPGTPQLEICDGLDNDCDGQVDEGLNGCSVVSSSLNINGDCVTANCPAAHPFPVGCNITMQGGDPRGCIANSAASSTVYFQEGDKCGVGRVTGTLSCATLPGVGLNATNCHINKATPLYPSSASGCPVVQ